MLSITLGATPTNTDPNGGGTLAPTSPPFPPGPQVPDGLKHLTQVLMPSLMMTQAPPPPQPGAPSGAPTDVPPGIPTTPATVAPTDQPPAVPVPPPLDTITPAPTPYVVVAPPPPGPVLPGIEAFTKVPTWVWWAAGLTLVGTGVGIALSR